MICSDDNDFIPYGNLLDDRILKEQQIWIFHSALGNWTERSQLSYGYDDLSLTFYDGVIGYVIRECNRYLQYKREGKYTYDEAIEFMKQWQYKGKVYRAINCKKRKVKYHGKIASWTKNINAFSKFNHLYSNQKYTFLVADATEFLGFDVNKYRKIIKERHRFTECEEEIIFPMDKKYVTDVFYGTLDEFKEYLKTSKNS